MLRFFDQKEGILHLVKFSNSINQIDKEVFARLIQVQPVIVNKNHSDSSNDVFLKLKKRKIIFGEPPLFYSPRNKTISEDNSDVVPNNVNSDLVAVKETRVHL